MKQKWFQPRRLAFLDTQHSRPSWRGWMSFFFLQELLLFSRYVLDSVLRVTKERMSFTCPLLIARLEACFAKWNYRLWSWWSSNCAKNQSKIIAVTTTAAATRPVLCPTMKRNSDRRAAVECAPRFALYGLKDVDRMWLARWQCIAELDC